MLYMIWNIIFKGIVKLGGGGGGEYWVQSFIIK